MAFSASLWSPYARYNGQVFLNLADLIILQHPHAHCTNHDTHYLMECARYRWLCPFFCPFRTFGSSHGPLCMFLLPIQKFCLTLLGLPKFLDCCLLGTMTCSWQVPLYVMVYLWPFLSRFRPLRRHTGQVSSGLPDLTIVQNILTHCSDHENHCAVEHARYRTFCLIYCPLENFGSPKFLTRTSIRTMAYTSAFHNIRVTPSKS